MVYVYEGSDWKFDVWCLAEEEIKSVTFTKRVSDELKKYPEKRVEILKMKEKYYNGEKYSQGYNGVKIYEEILFKK